MPNRTYRIWILITLVSAFSALMSCQSLSFRNEKEIRGKEGYYLIKPDTILDEIAQSKTDIFSLQIITPEPPLSQSLSTVEWTQEDFLSIVAALHKFVWHESIEDWHIRHILFYLNCEDVSKGAQSAYFIFYKVVENDQQTSRVEHQISIDPSNNSASWSEVEYRPNLVNQRPIELSKYNVSITDALKIAEKNGGEEVRLRVGNQCFLRVQLFNTSESWQVSYVKVLDLYTVDIDALTGKYKIINTDGK